MQINIAKTKNNVKNLCRKHDFNRFVGENRLKSTCHINKGILIAVSNGLFLLFN